MNLLHTLDLSWGSGITLNQAISQRGEGSMIRCMMFNQNFFKKVTRLLKMMSVMFELL